MPSQPKLETRAGVYLLTWQDEGIQIRADRIHVEKAGVYGEILIRNTNPTILPHIHGPVHFNFISTQGRRQLISHLLDAVQLDWNGLFEQLCYTVVEEHRRGTPAINIADHRPPERMRMRVAPLLQESQTTLIFGDGDSLKSFFATYLAVLVRDGKPAAGLTPEPGNVLYLDYETDVDTFWERVNMISSGLDIAPPDGLYYRLMVEPLVDEMPRVNKVVMDCSAELVIVDSAAPAVLEPNEADAATKFFGALRSLQTTVLVIAHQTKTSKGDYPFGSTFFRNLPRSNFHVKADREQDDVAISLRHTKSNNGRRLHPLGFKFHFEEDLVTVISVAPSGYKELRPGVPLRVRIAEVLTQPTSIKDLEKILEEPYDSISKALGRGAENNQFVRVGELWAKRYQQ